MSSCPALCCKSRGRVFDDARAITSHLAKSSSCAAWVAKNTPTLSLNHPHLILEPELEQPWLQEDENCFQMEMDDKMDCESDDHEMDGEIDDDSDLSIYELQADLDATLHAIPNDRYDSDVPHNENPPPLQPNTNNRYYIRPFRPGGRTFGTGETPYQLVKRNEVDPENIAYPFSGVEEWSLAYWLGKAGLSQNKINAFLRLDWVENLYDHDHAPSFRTAKDLLKRIESLPGAPRWYFRQVSLPEAPDDPQLLLYRDPVECLAWLEANPEYSQEKDYVPYEEYLDAAYQDRVYCEIASGQAWNDWQAEFPEEITILPYILASDSTHLTNFSGDKKIKPVIISNGHIHQHVRAAPNRGAFLCIAYFPDAKFTNIQFKSAGQHQRYPGYLRNRLHHVCMKIVAANLKSHTHVPRSMVDSEGLIRKEILRLVAYIGDLPEQSLIACLTSSRCVPCKAKTADFGSPEPCEPRTGESILQTIHAVRASIGPRQQNVSIQDDTWAFAEACRKVGLNGVEEPWWEDFAGLDICQVIGPDVLHGLHKAFKDHHLTWIGNLIGREDLDNAFILQPKIAGFRHFSIGLSKLSQFSGREHRDMQRYILAAIADHSRLHRSALRATRAELDFIYTAQYHAHTDSTLVQLKHYNKIFHDVKDIFIHTNARRGKTDTIKHFNIPKLHTRHHYAEYIKRIGSTANFSTETLERSHRIFAKDTFKVTSAHEYPKQMARALDRLEKMKFFDRYLAWCRNRQVMLDEPEHEAPDANDVDDTHDIHDEVCIAKTVYEPRLSQKPQYPNCNTMNILELYDISYPSFHAAVQRFEASIDLASRQQRSRGRGWVFEAIDASLPIHYNVIDVWTQFRINLPIVDELHDHLETHLIRAQPADRGKSGRFDIVFIDKNPDGANTQVGIRDFLIGQIRMIFRPLTVPGCTSQMKSDQQYLAFVELFDRGALHPETQMYSVKKAREKDGTRKCDIIRLDQVVQPCFLAPRYNGTPTTLKTSKITPHNCIEFLEEFWINCFFSKSTYQTVY